MEISPDVIQELSPNERRALLADLLRQRAGRQAGHRQQGVDAHSPQRARSKFSLFGDRPIVPMAELQADDGRHPFVRFINPYRGYLYSQLDVDKQFVSGEGCYLRDADGVRYLDFTAQYGALPFGFNPPEIWTALEAVRERGEPSFIQPSLMDAAGQLAQRLIEIAPPGLRYVTFTNSGAEAVEAAIKLCRAATGRGGILSTKNAFHGLTLGALSATGSAIYQRGFGAPVTGFEHVPYGDLAALRSALASRKGHYAAFLVEPIQGEGGIVDPPAGYLREAQSICREAGVLFVVDEVQTGLGRTGRMFAVQHEGLSPDVMTLAKALGGGLMPIGACLYGEQAYSHQFDLRHSSTFAGNTLACRAGLAALDLLERDQEALVRQVAQNGQSLKVQLEKLHGLYPKLVKSIRGRGYLQGVELDFAALNNNESLLSFLRDQELLIHLVVAYFLNVEGIRVAPSISAGSVLRIEPPLIAGEEECDAFVAALERVLDILERGDTARLLGVLIGGYPENATPIAASRMEASTEPPEIALSGSKCDPQDGRFAFIVHLRSESDYAKFDRSLAVFSLDQLRKLKNRVIRFIDAVPVRKITVEGKHGRKAHGEFILVPYTAEELIKMPHDAAVAEITLAVEMAQERGADVVGLAGFTSIATYGGLALSGEHLPLVTSGNSYTVVAAKQAVHMACAQRGQSLADLSAAIVGGAGMIGQALAVLLSEDLGRLLLIGNPQHPGRSRSRLRDVAAGVVRHLWDLYSSGRRFPVATLGARVGSLGSMLPANPQQDDFRRLAEEIESRHEAIVTATNIDAVLPKADVVVTATSSYEPMVFENHLKRNAIVCDVSRPLNVCENVAAARPDVMLIEGGMVRIPGDTDFGFVGSQEKGVTFACTAETVLLAMEGRTDRTGLCGTLDIPTIREIEQLAEKHDFRVVLGASHERAEQQLADSV